MRKDRIVTIIPAEPGWRRVTVSLMESTWWDEPIIAWRITFEPAAKGGYPTTWAVPICQGAEKEYRSQMHPKLIKSPDGQFTDEDGASHEHIAAFLKSDEVRQILENREAAE